MRTTILTGIATFVTVALATQPLRNTSSVRHFEVKQQQQICPSGEDEIYKSIHRIEATQRKTDQLILEEACEMQAR